MEHTTVYMFLLRDMFFCWCDEAVQKNYGDLVKKIKDNSNVFVGTKLISINIKVYRFVHNQSCLSVAIKVSI